MGLVLLNLQSNQQIKLEDQHPLIIGRGNVDGCHDKRVSRNHGRITCTLDGKIRLLALHCNPCFFTRNGVPPVLQLNKDEEETLSEGDCLGLLPNAFWFQVTSDKETKVKNEPTDCNSANADLQNSEKTVDNKLNENSEQKDLSENCTVIPENVKSMPDLPKDSSNSLPVSTDEVSKLASTSYGFGSPEFEKTRRLPLWMYEIDESIETNKSSKKHFLIKEEKEQNKKQKVTSTDVTAQEVKTECDENSDGDTRAKDEVELIIEASPKVENVDEPDSVSLHQVSSDSNIQAQGESSKTANQKEGYESDVNEEVGSLLKRPICQYEDKCYRKNPQHKLDFCHPGDADYVPYEQRPVCQYGAACYRKNEKHRVEFRHCLPGTSSHTASPHTSCTSLASSPLPAKRRRKKVKKQNSDYEDSDEYDLEDPFINDASSDDFVPSDWDSEEEDLDDFDASQDD